MNTRSGRLLSEDESFDSHMNSQNEENDIERAQDQRDLQLLEAAFVESHNKKMNKRADSHLETLTVPIKQHGQLSATAAPGESQSFGGFDCDSVASGSNGQPLMPLIGHDSDVQDFDDNATSIISAGHMGMQEGHSASETALAINQAYQDIVDSFINKVEVMLTQVREKQTAIQANLIEVTSSGSGTKIYTKVPVLQFLTPYFHDLSKMGAPPNRDAQQKIKDEENDALVTPAKKWFKQETEKLRDGLIEMVLERLMRPAMNRREIFVEKLKTTPEDEDETQAKLKEQIECCDEEIVQIGQRSPHQMLSTIDPSEFDWDTIAVHHLGGTRTAMECRLHFEHELKPGINTDPNWSKDEENKLKRLVDVQQISDWDEIARRLNTGRTAFQCLEHYQSKLNEIKLKWTNEEDQMLKQLVDECKIGNYIPWDQIAFYMPGRTRIQCTARYKRTLDPVIKRGRWTEDDDLCLVQAVYKYDGNWNLVAEAMPGRTAQQCRERFVGCLDENIKIGLWSPDEDEKLDAGIQTFGPGQWAQIAKLVPGRTASQCKVRYKVRQAKMVKGGRYCSERKTNVRGERLTGNLQRRNRLMQRIKELGLTFPSVKNSTAGATFDESTLSKLAASTRTLVERKLAQIHERYSVEAFQMRLGKKNSQRPSEAGSGRQKSVTACERKRRLPPDSNKPKSRSAAAAAAPSASQMKGGSAPKRKRVQNQSNLDHAEAKILRYAFTMPLEKKTADRLKANMVSWFCSQPTNMQHSTIPILPPNHTTLLGFRRILEHIPVLRAGCSMSETNTVPDGSVLRGNSSSGITHMPGYTASDQSAFHSVSGGDATQVAALNNEESLESTSEIVQQQHTTIVSVSPAEKNMLEMLGQRLRALFFWPALLATFSSEINASESE